MFRDDPRAWAQDAQAQTICLQALEAGQDQALKVVERWFLILGRQSTDEEVAFLKEPGSSF